MKKTGVPMRDELPLVTAGLPIYNDVKYIRSVLEDLVAQDYPALEILISDNASTDGTGDLCREFAARDSRVRVVTQPTNIGATANFSRVLDDATGEFFFWASSHDRREPTFVSKSVELLRADPKLVLVCPNARWIDAAGVVGKLLEPLSDTRHLDDAARFQVVLWSLAYAHPLYGVFRTSALRSTAGLDLSIGPDLVLLAELAVAGTFACVPETLLYIRSRSDPDDWSKYIERLLGHPPTPLEAEWMIALFLLGEARVSWQIRSRLGRLVGLFGVATSFALRRRWWMRAVWQDSARRSPMFRRGR